MRSEFIGDVYQEYWDDFVDYLEAFDLDSFIKKGDKKDSLRGDSYPVTFEYKNVNGYSDQLMKEHKNRIIGVIAGMWIAFYHGE